VDLIKYHHEMPDIYASLACHVKCMPPQIEEEAFSAEVINGNCWSIVESLQESYIVQK
jgi:hypothetical protein